LTAIHFSLCAGLRGDNDNVRFYIFSRCLCSIFTLQSSQLYLGIVLAVVVLVTGIFTYLQNAKSANLMAKFAQLLAASVRVKTDMSYTRRNKDDTAAPFEWINDSGADFNPLYLTEGDVIVLKSGDMVPADVRVLTAEDFKVNNSALTGEPDALERVAENKYHKPEDDKEATNMAFFGTDVKNGMCTGIVVRTGDNTFIGKIAQLTEGTDTEDTPIAKEIHHFIKIVSAVAISLGILFFIIGLAIGTDIITNLVFMIGIIVANVPEGLLATVTVCLTLTSQRMSEKNVLVKNLEGVETLGSTTAICSDKTGTLTQNKMTFAELLFDKKIYRTEFVARPDAAAQASGAKVYPDFDPESESFKVFHDAMCLNTTATFKPGSMVLVDKDSRTPLPFYSLGSAAGVPAVLWDTQGDASESSIIKFAQFMYPGMYKRDNMPTDMEEITEVFNADMMGQHRANYPQAPGGQIPFNSANKYHVKITKNIGNTEHPYTVWMKGAPERIVTRCDHYVHEGTRTPMSAEDQAEIEGLQMELMKQGRRVLAFAKYDIPASLVPAEKLQVEKSVKEPQVGPDGEVMREKNGAPIMVDVRRKCPFNLDQLVRNVPLGDPAVADGAGRDELIAKWKTTNFVKGTKPSNAPAKSTEWEQDEYDAILAGMENSKMKLTLIGMSALIDPPRPSVPEAVLDCQRAGVRVVMVTGDHPQTAAAIAKLVNIFSGPYKFMGPVKNGVDPLQTNDEGKDVRSVRGIVVPGWELAVDTPDEKWAFIFAHDEIVFARTSPQQKLQIVKRFQDMESEIVAVTGDGVNDAPALKAADIGVAMGIAGTEVTKGAADMILTDDNFASIVRGVREGRLIFDNLKKSIAYTLSSNIPEIAPFLTFITVQTPLPLSTVLILAIDLGTDMVPAISMAWENPEADIMRRPARDAAVDRLVTKKLISFAYLQIGVIQAIAGFFTWLVVLNDYGYPAHILPGRGAFDNWSNLPLMCKTTGGRFFKIDGNNVAVSAAASAFTDGNDAVTQGFLYWDPNGDGEVDKCTHPARNFQGSGDEPSGFKNLDGKTYGTFTADTNVITVNSRRALREKGYYPFFPWRGVQSEYWNQKWLTWDYADASDVNGAGEDTDSLLLFGSAQPGFWVVPNTAEFDGDAQGRGEAVDSLTSVTGSIQYLDVDKTVYTGGSVPTGNTVVTATLSNSDKRAKDAVFVQAAVGECLNFFAESITCPTAEGESTGAYLKTDADGTIRVNVANRMMQDEALHHGQTAYFISIVIVQWADLLICKTRWLSLYHQGMVNPAMNFGLLFETVLAAFLCYVPGVDTALGTRAIRLLHWVPAVPFSIVIFLYDEVRKYIMRKNSSTKRQGKQVITEYGWLARNTYY